MTTGRCAAAFLLLAAACGKSGTGTEPDLETITQSGSAPATAAAGSIVTVSFRVLHGPAGAVTLPKSGEPVTFTVISGAGTLDGSASRVVNTGVDGIATADWRLGPAAGPEILRGSINGSQSVDVSVTGTVSTPPRLTLLTAPSGNPQSGIPFFQQPVVQVADPNGNPVAQAGVPVTVSVASGGGTLGVTAPTPGADPASVASLVVNSNANGQARFDDLLLNGGGAVTLQFSAPGYDPVQSSGLNLTASPVVFTLSNGNEHGPFTSAAGSQTYAGFVVPAGTTELRAALYNGLGTVYLYGRQGNYPTLTHFDCSSTQSGVSQLCVVTNPPAGQWYFVADGVAGFQNVLARTVAYGPACARQTMTIGTAVNGQLTPATDCAVPVSQGSRDRYALAPAGQSVVTFDLTSSNTITVELKSATSSRHRIISLPAGGVSLPFLLAPGDHDVEVVDAVAGFPGGQTYSLTATPVSPNLGSCAPILMLETGVVATDLNLAATDCAGITAGTRSDRFYTWALTGQLISVTMSSTAFDPFLRVLTGQSLGNATVLTSDDNSGGGTTARVTWLNLGPPASFTIEATSTAAGGSGLYTLSFVLGPAVYNAPPIAPAATRASSPAPKGYTRSRPLCSSGPCAARRRLP